MTARAKDIIKRFDELKSERMPFDSLWQEIADFNLPNAADFNRTYGIGQKRRQYLYDNTGEHSLKIFASSIIGFLANPAARWFTLGIMNEEINRDQEVSEWLDEAGKTVLNAFNEPSAKFYGHLFTSMVGIGAFGTTAMMVQEGISSQIEFTSQSVKDLFISEGHNGAINTVYRQLKFSGQQLLEKESLRGWSISEKTRKAALKDPSKKFDVIHVIRPRKERVGTLGAQSLEFEGVYVEKDMQHELIEESYLTFPIPVARWERTAVEPYGRSPAMTALADVKTANSMQKSILVASEKQLNPPMQMPSDGSLGMLDTSAHAINFYNPKEGEIKPLLSLGNISIARDDLLAVQDAIRRAFFVDQLQIVGTPQMTATEVLQRQDEKGRLLAPSIGMVQAELIGPIVESTFTILLNNGVIPPAPEILAGQDVKVLYVSPLTRAQRGGEAQSLLEFMQSVASVAEIFPEALDRIDIDASIEELHEIGGVPARVLKSLSDAEGARVQRAEAQQQQQALEVAQQGAAAAKDASQAGLI